MAQTMPNFPKAMRLEDERRFIGRQFNIPIRTRTPWDNAVKWLEERASVEAEWPWPKWEDYRAR